MLRPSHRPLFDHLNNILWTVQIIELLIAQFSPVSFHFILRPNILLRTLSQTLTICVLHLTLQTMFHNHAKQQVGCNESEYIINDSKNIIGTYSNDDDDNSIQFIYLRAWQQLEKANYSHALKQQYRRKYNMLKSARLKKSRINIKEQTKNSPDVQYETYRV
jgi:hypothetical protein